MSGRRGCQGGRCHRGSTAVKRECRRQGVKLSEGNAAPLVGERSRRGRCRQGSTAVKRAHLWGERSRRPGEVPLPGAQSYRAAQPPEKAQPSGEHCRQGEHHCQRLPRERSCEGALLSGGTVARAARENSFFRSPLQPGRTFQIPVLL